MERQSRGSTLLAWPMGDMPLRFRGNGRGPAQSTAPRRGFGGRLREGAWSGCGGGEVFSLWLPLSGPRGRQGSRRCLCSNEGIICLRGGKCQGFTTVNPCPVLRKGRPKAMITSSNGMRYQWILGSPLFRSLRAYITFDTDYLFLSTSCQLALFRISAFSPMNALPASSSPFR